MNDFLQQETERLTRSWTQHDPAMLRDYLVADVEDPRLNVQSILTRHFLLHAIFGQRFAELMDAELRFAVAMNWLLQTAREITGADDWRAIAAGLDSGADNAEGITLPGFLRSTRACLPAKASGQNVPDYLGAFLRDAAAGQGTAVFSPSVLDTFMALWRAALVAETPPDRPTVLEPACGSANDYRFIEACGLARFLDYTGFDLCEANVANARTLFPGARFEIGNAFAIAAPDRAFDYAFVHDLFEHFSPAGLEAAVAELCRVTRQGLCVGCFQMDEIEDHIVRPVDDYHVNTLSLARTLELFAAHGFTGEAVHIGTFLRLRFGCEHTHNPNAYTLVLGT